MTASNPHLKSIPLRQNPLHPFGVPRFVGIEILEARIAPATLIWDGSAGDGNWFNAQNWDQNAVPGNGDTAILDIASTINLTANATVSSFHQSNGTLTSPAGVTLNVLTSLNWTGGTMSGAGPTSVTKIAATATLTIGGAATKTLQQRTLSNDGTAIWSGTGEKIGPASIGGQTLPLADGADNQLLDAINGNFRLVDFS